MTCELQDGGGRVKYSWGSFSSFPGFCEISRGGGGGVHNWGSWGRADQLTRTEGGWGYLEAMGRKNRLVLTRSTCAGPPTPTHPSSSLCGRDHVHLNTINNGQLNSTQLDPAQLFTPQLLFLSLGSSLTWSWVAQSC